MPYEISNYDEDLSEAAYDDNSPATHDYGQCVNCGHGVGMHTLKGVFGPDECHSDCDCRYYNSGDDDRN